MLLRPVHNHLIRSTSVVMQIDSMSDIRLDIFIPALGIWESLLSRALRPKQAHAVHAAEDEIVLCSHILHVGCEGTCGEV